MEFYSTGLFTKFLEYNKTTLRFCSRNHFMEFLEGEFTFKQGMEGAPWGFFNKEIMEWGVHPHPPNTHTHTHTHTRTHTMGNPKKYIYFTLH